LHNVGEISSTCEILPETTENIVIKVAIVNLHHYGIYPTDFIACWITLCSSWADWITATQYWQFHNSNPCNVHRCNVHRTYSSQL